MRLIPLKPIINHPATYGALMDYFDDEIALAYRELGRAQDLRDLGIIQGKIELLTKLKRLRDTVNGAET